MNRMSEREIKMKNNERMREIHEFYECVIWFKL